jgi:hypothetical protein
MAWALDCMGANIYKCQIKIIFYHLFMALRAELALWKIEAERFTDKKWR